MLPMHIDNEIGNQSFVLSFVLNNITIRGLNKQKIKIIKK